MSDRNPFKWKILTLTGLICLMIPFSIYSLWIYVFNLFATQAERVSAFKAYFPDFLNGRWSMTIIGMVFSVLAIILSSLSLKHLKKIWNSINVIILIMGCVLLFLNLLSMM